MAFLGFFPFSNHALCVIIALMDGPNGLFRVGGVRMEDNRIINEYDR